MKTRRTPLRKCAGCGEMKPKKELVRIVKSPQGEISPDITGKAQGRGAYLCPSIACLRAAKKARRLEKSFSCRIPDDLYDRMEKELTADDG